MWGDLSVAPKDICRKSLEERDLRRLWWLCTSYSGFTSMPDHLLGFSWPLVSCSVLLLLMLALLGL